VKNYKFRTSVQLKCWWELQWTDNVLGLVVLRTKKISTAELVVVVAADAEDVPSSMLSAELADVGECRWIVVVEERKACDCQFLKVCEHKYTHTHAFGRTNGRSSC
jgi:hypothetical protein